MTIRYRVLALALATLSLLAPIEGVADHAQAATYRVAYTNGDRVLFRWTPNVNDKKQPPRGAPEGASIEVLCQAWSPTVAGPRNNHIFDFIQYQGERAWIPDAYVNTPAPANQFSNGIARCQPGSSDIRNGDIVGVATNDPHSWGPCTVQDFNQNVPGTPWGWYIRGGRGHINHTLRNGMLWGWFDNSGGGGSLACPVGDEYGYRGGVRQDFDGGWLLWCPGWERARRWVAGMADGCSAPAAPRPASNQTIEAAISWARGKMGQNYASGECLRFVREAYQAAGRDIGRAPSAVDYWNQRRDAQHRDLNVPRGALVFWGAERNNQYGHVALALGNDRAISTSERENLGPNHRVIHEMSIADRNKTKPYLGWIMPV